MSRIGYWKSSLRWRRFLYGGGLSVFFGVCLILLHLYGPAPEAGGDCLTANRGKKLLFKPQTGVASWYGPRFHGRPTANGEIFNANTLTAAHRSLPFGTLVRVTHLENGRSVIVRINDRGPYYDRRVIDLSRRSAALLDMEEQGIARVRIDVLDYPSRKAPIQVADAKR